MAKRTAAERIDSALTKKKFQVPEDFAPDASKPIHENLQRAFAANLLKDGPLKATFKSGWDIWLYQPYLGGVSGKTKKWVDLGHADGGNYTVFTFDYESEDPAVYLFDHEDFDDSNDQPKDWRRLAPSLSSFIGSLKPEQAPKRAPKKKKGAVEAFSDPVVVPYTSTYSVELVSDETYSVVMNTKAENMNLIARDGTVTELPKFECAHVASACIAGGQIALGINRYTDDGEIHELAYSRQTEGAWSQFDTIAVPNGNSYIRSIAIEGDLMVAAQPTELAVHIYRRESDAWSLETTLTQPDDETWFGQDLSIDDGRIAIVSWKKAFIYQRDESGEWTGETLPVQNDWPHLMSVGLSGDLLVVGDTKDGSHLDDSGNPTGQERRQSGAISVFRRTDGKWGAPLLLKKKGAKADEQFGQQVHVGDGWLAATTGHRTLQRSRVVYFVPDGDRYTQVFESIDYPWSDYGRSSAITNETFVAYDKDMVSIFALAESFPPAPPKKAAKKKGEPVSRTILSPVEGRKVDGLGKYLAASKRWVAATDGISEGSKIAVIDTTTCDLTLVDHAFKEKSIWLGQHAICGDTLLSVEWWQGKVVRIATKTFDGEAWTPGPDFDESFNEQNLPSVFLAVGDRFVISTYDSGDVLHFYKRSGETFEKEGEVALGFETGAFAMHETSGEFLVTDPIHDKVILRTIEEELVRFEPAKATKKFGMGCAFSGDEIIIGSGTGAHVFDRDGNEKQLLKVARNKKWGDDVIRANEDTIVVSSSTMLKGEGALVVFERDPKKGWKKSATIPGVMTGVAGYDTHGEVGFTGAAIYVGFPNRNEQRGMINEITL